MGESSPAQYVEQYLLFDPTEFIKGIGYIGTVATIELIALESIELIHCEEPRELPELLQLHSREDDNLPRLFKV